MGFLPQVESETVSGKQGTFLNCRKNSAHTVRNYTEVYARSDRLLRQAMHIQCRLFGSLWAKP